MTALEATNLVKVYRGGSDEVAAVRGASLKLEEGELVLLMGPSGSGKTTLLSMLGCILTPDAGTLRVGEETVVWNESRLPAYRRRCFGFIYQHFNLLSSLNVCENVQVPLVLAGRRSASDELAEHALGTVSLAHRLRFQVSELSGGEKQRVAIARAIVADAPILLADEPTGNLDGENGRGVMALLRRLAVERGKAVLVVTHDERAVPYAHRVLHMEDGVVYAS
ncbi:MAG: ABC transporter ATP-binding protein [Planctomycetes bacterium]|nr:ABC transporter ATP-binding protein [Planctomycetota bacterium]